MAPYQIKGFETTELICGGIRIDEIIIQDKHQNIFPYPGSIDLRFKYDFKQVEYGQSLAKQMGRILTQY
ncbi:hypothetical protein H6G76_33035 [Nostoc sp. FACHB-152]|uniref:hypothetical protein n=1 Tax=Nostoc sp. FACHB-152 TaxID=2692837 RepID=UPI0016844C26|nr:hypothetical protein [Nostoc sp. FACHB-152]MBD2451863.1 hypothetical protein [Nostoc sp. FACHB-152]